MIVIGLLTRLSSTGVTTTASVLSEFVVGHSLSRNVGTITVDGAALASSTIFFAMQSDTLLPFLRSKRLIALDVWLIFLVVCRPAIYQNKKLKYFFFILSLFLFAEQRWCSRCNIMLRLINIPVRYWNVLSLSNTTMRFLHQINKQTNHTNTILLIRLQNAHTAVYSAHK